MHVVLGRIAPSPKFTASPDLLLLPRRNVTLVSATLDNHNPRHNFSYLSAHKSEISGSPVAESDKVRIPGTYPRLTKSETQESLRRILL